MTPEEFAAFLIKVRSMRDSQKAYFRGRGSPGAASMLASAKSLEREVDSLISEFDRKKADSNQTKLF